MHANFLLLNLLISSVSCMCHAKIFFSITGVLAMESFIVLGTSIWKATPPCALGPFGSLRYVI